MLARLGPGDNAVVFPRVPARQDPSPLLTGHARSNCYRLTLSALGLGGGATRCGFNSRVVDVVLYALNLIEQDTSTCKHSYTLYPLCARTSNQSHRWVKRTLSHIPNTMSHRLIDDAPSLRYYERAPPTSHRRRCCIRTSEGAISPLLMFPLKGAIVSGVFATCLKVSLLPKRAAAPRI